MVPRHRIRSPGRRVPEAELPWLPGYAGSSPVRVGNAAAQQFQLDVYGEVMATLHLAQASGIAAQEPSWQLQRALVDFVVHNWDTPDEGIWEVRGPRRHFTHSKVMAWLALDCAVSSVEDFGLEGPVEDWRRVRAEIHAATCARGFDAELGAFVQYFGGRELDASLLMIPLVGFLPADDRRVVGTVAAIERGLMQREAREAGGGGLRGLPRRRRRRRQLVRERDHRAGVHGDVLRRVEHQLEQLARARAEGLGQGRGDVVGLRLGKHLERGLARRSSPPAIPCT